MLKILDHRGPPSGLIAICIAVQISIEMVLTHAGRKKVGVFRIYKGVWNTAKRWEIESKAFDRQIGICPFRFPKFRNCKDTIWRYLDHREVIDPKRAIQVILSRNFGQTDTRKRLWLLFERKIASTPFPQFEVLSLYTIHAQILQTGQHRNDGLTWLCVVVMNNSKWNKYGF